MKVIMEVEIIGLVGALFVFELLGEKGLFYIPYLYVHRFRVKVINVQANTIFFVSYLP